MNKPSYMQRGRVCGLIILLFAIVTACRRDSTILSSSRYTSFSNAQLVTQFYKSRSSDEDLPLFHILFVPVVEPSPQSGFGVSFSGGGTVDELEFRYAYEEFDWSSRKRSIHSHPVHVRNLTTVEAEGHSYRISKGSVFVAHVDLDGALKVIQLPLMARELDLAPDAVLVAIKRQIPADKRLQNLPLH